MGLTVQNQKPVELSPIYTPLINGSYNSAKYLSDTVTKKAFTPLIQGNPVVIKTSDGDDVDEDSILSAWATFWDSQRNLEAESLLKDFYKQTLRYFDKDYDVNALFPIQAGVKAGLPMPSPTIIYDPATDIIPAAKDLLTGNIDGETFMANLAFYAKADALVCYMLTESVFEDFKNFINQNLQTLQSVIPSETLNLLNQFNGLKLNVLTQALMIREDHQHKLEEYSFPRVIIEFLFRFLNNNGSAGIMPFTVTELVIPQNLIFVNVEKHARATPKEIAKEWKDIREASKNPIRVLNKNQITKLDALQKNLQHMQNRAAAFNNNRKSMVTRMKNTKFQKTAIQPRDYAIRIKKKIDQLGFTQKSQNIYISKTKTFGRPNRRDPNNPNLMGKFQSQKYKPDLHLYLDTSGSITQAQYQDAVKAAIMLAKKLEINLYINSFSHVMSTTSLLIVRDRSPKQIFADFIKIPKVTGGTDFAQIWTYIDASQKRRQELSIIITDFGYTAGHTYQHHPKNLYYMPCSNANWDAICRWARDFCDSMLRNDPAIRTKLLF